MRFLHRLLASSLVLSLAACAADPNAAEEDAVEAEAAVTGGRITSARPEIGLVHVDGIRGFLGDMGWATGTVVLQRNAVLTSAQATGGKSLANRSSGWGTFTITSARGRTVHRVVEASTVQGTKLVMLRIDPAAPADVVPAAIGEAGSVDRARSDGSATTFLGYGFRNLVCLPMTGSDGNKSFVTRRYDQFGGLFTGPLGVGYTCEGDIGGPIVAGGPSDRGAILSVNVNTAIDTFEEPGRQRATITRIVGGWQTR